MAGLPNFVTHYHRADRRPFQNLGDLDGPELADVLAGLAGPGSGALSHRRFGSRYMALRRSTEAVARELFVAAGSSSSLPGDGWSAGVSRLRARRERVLGSHVEVQLWFAAPVEQWF